MKRCFDLYYWNIYRYTEGLGKPKHLIMNTPSVSSEQSVDYG